MQKPDLRAFYLAALCVCCGLLSPSNEVDDSVLFRTGETISIALIVVLLSLLAYLLFLFTSEKKAS